MTELFESKEGIAILIAFAGLVVSAVALAVSIGMPLYTIKESNRARDFASIESIRRGANEAAAALRSNMEDENSYNLYAGMYLDVLEFAAHAVNNRMLGKAGTKFLADYVETEMRTICEGQSLKRLAQPQLAGGTTYSELHKFCRDRSIPLERNEPEI